MQKFLLILSFLLNGLHLACAQNGNPIVVQHGDLLSYATSLDNALSIAATGDAIYLPAGSFSTQSGISKKVSIYGVGYRRDVADISGVTVIQGNINVTSSATGTLISGVHIQTSLTFVDANIDNFILTNCKIASIVSGSTQWNPCINAWAITSVTIKECVILNTIMSKLGGGCNHRINFNIQNSIIQPQLFGDNFNVTNCVILNSGNAAAFDFNSSSVTNSIIYANYVNSIGSSYFNNNLIVGIPNSGIDTTNRQNLYKASTYRDTVFVNNTTTNFNEENDYHTKPACTVCANKGIYSGATPYKPLPANPHLVSKVIPNSVNGQSLRFEIRVRLSNQ
ncbi:MAG: hypothetical protein RIS64_4004 [Bacteroidota bacterium]|jgi:hypothetical protein